MSKLLALADRIERATRPDRELDCTIYRALGWEPVANPTSAGGLAGRWQRGGEMTMPSAPPAYTASLDAAMTLVPEGLHFGCGSCDATTRAWAWCGDTPSSADEDLQVAHAATSALALTAAVLRARAASAIEAGTDETPLGGSAEGESAVPEGDAK
jgi:hypothetical protein